MLSSVAYVSAETLWDLVVTVKTEPHIELHERPVVFGTILNQAMKPVSGAEVKITFGANSATIMTNSSGNFRLEFSEQTIPGVFTVNVFAKNQNMKGFGSTTFRIAKQLTTFNELYYTANSTYQKNTAKSDPYESLKIKNYEKFLKEQNKSLQKQIQIEAAKAALQKRKEAANQDLNQTMTELKPGPGSFSGYKYDRYFAGLNPSVRDDIANQMNQTQKTVTDAEVIMKKILDSGGTKGEARKAYLEKLSTKRDSMEKIADLNGTENHSKMKKYAEKTSNVKGLVAKKIHK
jgi:hypothetical protein